jgi:hypothetical protein
LSLTIVPISIAARPFGTPSLEKAEEKGDAPKLKTIKAVARSITTKREGSECNKQLVNRLTLVTTNCADSKYFKCKNTIFF